MDAALNVRTILGIKLKRRREERRLTLAELASGAGIATSYLAEIESGKKYPKAEKILRLAAALGCAYDELVSTKLDGDFGDLQEFLNAPGVRDFPFHMFGVPSGDLMRLLTHSPHEVGALIRTLADIARSYNIGVEHFLHAALRSYQELTGNYYEELESAAEGLARALGVRAAQPAPALDALRGFVLANGVAEIDERTLGERAALNGFRSVRVLAPRPRLLLNPRLTRAQKAFVLAREAGYKVLGLSARSLTAPPDREDSFEQVLNDFKASYFAGAVLLPRAALGADLRAFFKLKAWQGEALLGLLERHATTAETLMYRLSQLVPRQFGLRTHFLRFNDEGGSFELVKQLNSSELSVPAGIGVNEHYCRRWLSTRLLLELRASQRRRPRDGARPIVGAQRSRFPEGKAFFCLGLAQPLPLRPGVSASLTLGFRAEEKLFRSVRFASDRTIPETLIAGTCERCPLGAAECDERAAPALAVDGQRARAERQRELERLAQGA